MDYKKKYEQALENLKRIKAANKDNKELVDFIEYQYPELKESEDERIRKAIIDFFSEPGRKEYILNGFTVDGILAWLEKQGEQKPAWWSEEDDVRYYGVIETEQYMLDVVNGVRTFAVGDEQIRKECTKELAWLKSLKERMEGE